MTTGGWQRARRWLCFRPSRSHSANPSISLISLSRTWRYRLTHFSGDMLSPRPHTFLLFVVFCITWWRAVLLQKRRQVAKTVRWRPQPANTRLFSLRIPDLDGGGRQLGADFVRALKPHLCKKFHRNASLLKPSNLILIAGIHCLNSSPVGWVWWVSTCYSLFTRTHCMLFAHTCIVVSAFHLY